MAIISRISTVAATVTTEWLAVPYILQEIYVAIIYSIVITDYRRTTRKSKQSSAVQRRAESTDGQCIMATRVKS